MPHSFTHAGGNFLLDGRPFLIFSGEMHYFRIPHQYWRHRLQCARAMGLNTIATYMPWNLHERRPGEFDFSGDLDVVRYIKIAQEEGLFVILRPGPFICSEWDFGGLPAWLLKIPDIKVRCMDERYLAAVQRYIRRVGEECSSLLIGRGGPVILTQVENEYGAFGNDRAYMDEMCRMVRAAGFNELLYTCDWANPANLKAGEVSDAVTVANFGSKAHEQIPALARLRPNQPLMCGEFWCGWFSAWGQPRAGTGDADTPVNELKWMLENNTSFNLYMFHGGTSFGLMAGANHYESYAPTISSYDFWAPLDESGRPNAKFHAIGKLLAQHQPSGVTLPKIPEPPLPLIRIPEITFTQSAALMDNLPAPRHMPQPVPMEYLDQNFGLILYRTDIAGLCDQELLITQLCDYAKVYLNGSLAGTLNRSKHEDKLKLTGVPNDKATLDILVDTMGRTNFGPKLLDRKGITERVCYGNLTLMGWDVFSFPLDTINLDGLNWKDADAAGPAFHRGWFNLDAVGDTFLDMRPYKRGVVWVNGHCVSRFWRVGPQQTCFLPGAWLREGRNEIVIFDLESPGRRTIAGLKEPILDELTESDSAAIKK